MMRAVKLCLLLFLPVFFVSCIKEKPLNDECDILSAWVEGEAYEAYFYQRSGMAINNVPSNSEDIVFTVRSAEGLPPMPVQFTLSPGATIEPANGSLQDFSQGPVTYTVRSEDGQWVRTYKVSFEKRDLSATLFSFEHVDTEHNTNNGCSYNVFYEIDSLGTRNNIWASGNAGVALTQQNWSPEEFPTHSVDEGYRGKGVCLRTQYAGDLAAWMGKPLASGNLFIGTFNVNAVLTNALKATEFGIAADRQPVRVKGWYKYHPGAVFTDGSMNEVPGRVDECHIYAVFYRNQDASGNRVVLDGTNVLTSEYIVSKAQLTSLPATDEWTRFEMTFEGSTADPELLSAQGYSFTVVFSSSKAGDLFEGAIGSTLYIDEVEVEF